MQNKFLYAGTFYALCAISLLSFISISLAASNHILLLLAGLPLVLLKPFNIKNIPLSSWTIILLLITGLISNLSNELTHPLKSYSPIKYFFFALVGVFAYQHLFDWGKFREQLSLKNRYISNLLKVFLITTSLASLSGLIAYYTGWNPLKWHKACHPDRSCGLFGMYMTYGYSIQFFNLLLVGLILYWKKIKEYSIPLFPPWILGLILILNLVGLYTSFCRGAFIGFLVALPFFYFRLYKRSFIALIIAIPILAGSLFMLSPTVQNIFASKERLLSNSERISQFQAALIVARENPVFGIGLRNFEYHAVDIKKKYGIAYAEMAGHAHNNFLEYLAANGILGFILILCFHLFWLLEMIKRQDIIGDMGLPIVIALFISGQFQYTLGDAGVMFLIMTLYSLSQIRTALKYEHTR